MTAAPDHRPLAVVTGASSGIGKATARVLAEAGFHVVVAARRVERCRQVAEAVGGTAVALDVTDDTSVAAFAGTVLGLGPVRVLVNNAGGAKGLAPVSEADLDDWRWMWETNVLGTLRVTRALLPSLVESGDGLVVTVTSTAALEVYDNGSGYTSAKHAQAVLHRTLRGELLGQPVRFTEVCPGIVATDFSLVRFEASPTPLSAPPRFTRDSPPLTAQDVAEVIGFAATRPSHVDLDQIVVKPRDQVSAARVHRR